MTKPHSLLNVKHDPDSPTLCTLAGKPFGAAAGGLRILALFEASQEVVEASICKEESGKKNEQRKSITVCVSSIRS